MRNSRNCRVVRPLDAPALNQLALTYVARYATSSGKLATYLARKVKERGWANEDPAAIDQVVERMIELRYIDDQSYAELKAGSLLRRGYGPGRVRAALRVAGISADIGQAAADLSDEASLEAGMAFAKRRRFGPFAVREMDRNEQQRAVAAMLRAGHSFDIIKVVMAIPTSNNEQNDF
jgi:regulatory protein